MKNWEEMGPAECDRYLKANGWTPILYAAARWKDPKSRQILTTDVAVTEQQRRDAKSK